MTPAAPLTLTERRPPRDRIYIWLPGEWAWGDRGYRWIPGRYVLPPRPHSVWIPGEWMLGPEGHVTWLEGHSAPAP